MSGDRRRFWWCGRRARRPDLRGCLANVGDSGGAGVGSVGPTYGGMHGLGRRSRLRPARVFGPASATQSSALLVETVSGAYARLKGGVDGPAGMLLTAAWGAYNGTSAGVRATIAR